MTAPSDSYQQPCVRWRRFVEPPVPRHLAARHQGLDEAPARRLGEALDAHYFAAMPAGYLKSERGQRDRSDHLQGRLRHARTYVVPWLDYHRPLDGCRLLEIGCGTGSATVAFAEQGANVTAIDVDEESQAVARCRCECFGVKADFRLLNALDLDRLDGSQPFDVIVFYASLEHMTLDERVTALSKVWALVVPGGFLGVVDTPNRLWYFDSHTAQLPFFHWLPDDLAIRYAQFSPDVKWHGRAQDPSPAGQLAFLRRGRGVSYHEFDLAIAPVSQLSVLKGMNQFHRDRDFLRRLWHARSRAGRYEAFLRDLSPTIPDAFLGEYLNVLIRKP